MNRRLQEPTGAGHWRSGSEVGVLDRRRGSLWCQLSNRLMGAHAVGLIEHHQIPLRGLLQPALEIIVPRELTHTGDQQGPIREGIAQAGGVNQVAGEQLELQLELSLSSSCHFLVSEP